MGIPIFQVDAFTEQPFSGNPAAVCLPPHLDDEPWMQQVAAEMNVSETAFLRLRSDGSYDLRWFTPTTELALCGHATVAVGHILWETHALFPGTPARFHTASGLLRADRQDGRIVLDFPASPPPPEEPPEGLLAALGLDHADYVGRSRFDLLVEVDAERAVRDLKPDVARLKALGVRGVIVTAELGQGRIDFVSRFFAPGVGIDEDPVTGSSHCALAPFWAHKLGRTDLVGYQASTRGGVVHCRVVGDRVRLGGTAVTVLRGELVSSAPRTAD